MLNQADLRPLLQNRELFEGAFKVIEDTILAHDRGESGYVAAAVMPLAGDVSYNLYVQGSDQAGSIRVYPSTGRSDLPPNSHVMLLLEPIRGELLAILAGDDLNPLRTAIPIGVGARYLAKPNSRVLCILGTSRQGRAHAQVLTHALPGVDTIRVWSPTKAHREAYAREVQEVLDRPIEVTETAQQAVEGADVVSMAGLSRGTCPVEASWLAPGSVLLSMGGP
ncbi:MAG: hypothetical protein JOZ39_03205, partial [Chloroflexi bacterium]|nr:hypothetical protein [Chloroflexota bacterium]